MKKKKNDFEEKNELGQKIDSEQNNDANKNITESEQSNEEQTQNSQPSDLELKEAELNKTLEKVTELENQTNKLKDALLRKAAEFENYKRRNENDQLNLLKFAAEPFIKSILTVYDDLERSFSHVNNDNNFESLKKGLDLVYDKFTKILESQGVKKINAKGQPFDVELHEALMQQPVDGVPPHTVLDVIEHGYFYKDRVIRHAKVIVSAETVPDQEGESLDSNKKSDDLNQEGQVNNG